MVQIKIGLLETRIIYILNGHFKNGMSYNLLKTFTKLD